MLSRSLLISLSGLMIISQFAMAGVYRWTDAQGHVHYSDRPQSPDAEEIRIQSKPSDTGGNKREEVQKQLEEKLQGHAERREAVKETAHEKDTLKIEKATNCKTARERMDTIKKAQYLYEQLEGGEQRVYSDEERAQAEIEAQEEVRKWCG